MDAEHAGASAPRLLIANPSADVYGSDLQMLESVRAMVAAGWSVHVLTASDGPLTPQLTAAGARVRVLEFPVLRRSFASLRGMVQLVGTAAAATWRLRKVIRAERPDVVYVNTVTLPWWLLAARLTRTPVMCHVHEAEAADRRVVRTALTAPLMLANCVVVNGRPAADVATDAVPWLRRRITTIENGVAGPPAPIAAAPAELGTPGRPARLTVIGRLSPRKATHVALDAAGLLRARGRAVEVEVCGDAFPGYEWYVDELQARASRADLAGAVTFAGYVNDVWQALERSDIVLAPSLGESLGNAVIQAQMARRPVVASDVHGHTESVEDGVTGLLVPPADADAMAAAVERLLDDPLLRAAVAETGSSRADARFSIGRYGQQMAATISSLRRPARTR